MELKYKAFSKDLKKSLGGYLESAIEDTKGSQKLVAAFDADGTLWDCDLGENFFRYEIEKNLVPLPPHPWKHYLELKSSPHGPQKAYSWLAEIHKGIELSQVRRWALEALEYFGPIPYFEDQKKWIEALHLSGVEVYVVTASVKWAVEPGASFFGISQDHVLGVVSEVYQGKITGEPKLPITYREGKVEALLQSTGGRRPFFCCGNSEGDTELLLAATHGALAVSAASLDDKLYRSEIALQRLAEKQTWLRHRFVLTHQDYG